MFLSAKVKNQTKSISPFTLPYFAFLLYFNDIYFYAFFYFFYFLLVILLVKKSKVTE